MKKQTETGTNTITRSLVFVQNKTKNKIVKKTIET